MNDEDVILDVLEPSSGAHFLKCALQVNPHHYVGTYRGQQSDGNPAEYAKAIVEKAEGTGISVLAIADHNSVSDISAFLAAAEGRNITIFPGFELSSSEGVHVLCIYSPDTAKEQLERYLGEFGIRRTEPSPDLSSQSFEEILTGVREQGGITIAAHITNANGLFEVLDGQSRIRAWQNPDLLAVQIPGPIDDLADGVRRIVENKDPNYHRIHSAGERQAVAVVNAKDVTQPQDLRDLSASCWIKMSQVNIDGLRQAFLDPVSRIRLNSDPEPEEHAELCTLAWQGGFLDGVTIHFNPNLNVLVGGRGAGKSTVIESLRYVLDLDPIGDDALATHNGTVSQVLRSGTKISLRARAYRPTEYEYLIERTVPNPPIVREEGGRISNLLPVDVFPGVEIYGQHEISELAGRPEKCTSLLDRFVRRDESLSERKNSVRRDLENTRRSLTNTHSELQQINDRLAKLPNLEETLARYREAGLEERLREQSLLVREERVLESIPERVQGFRDCLHMLRQDLPIDRAFLSQKALQQLPGREILTAANPVIERLNSDLEPAANLIEDALNRADEGIGVIRSQWSQRQTEVEAEYQTILRELRKSAVDGAEFIRLRREIEGLRPLRERRILLERLETELANRRLILLAEWEEIKAIQFRLLDRAARTVSTKLRDRVQVEVTAAGNREPLYTVLRQEIRGRLSETIDQIGRLRDFSLPQFVKCCRDGAEAVQETYSIPSTQADRLCKATPETLMTIEELDLPPITAIQLNKAPAGSPPVWQALKKLSKGQKATAILLLLLLESDAPLIVDQPEDDLDNRFITDDVVPRMRNEKRRRQFVFATHNANIPVLGDAEQILGLTAFGEAGDGNASIKPEHTGSIDSRHVRELVEEILEGGKEAFETRRLKYGF